MNGQHVTRLAPSPTGALHLGNARTFFANWLLARQEGWRVVLRIDDLDGPRVKAGGTASIADDLQFLGLDWDDGPTFQSHHAARYSKAVDRLFESGTVYPCVCTRTEIERAASAPHAEDGAAVYPGTCRGRFASVAEATAFSGRPCALRFAVPSGVTSFVDTIAGSQSYDVAQALGDFIVVKPDGTPAYQLATVVDDSAAGVTRIVRGDDLLDSTPRQILLYHALGKSDAIPLYAHLPLVVGPDGRRLAKRHGDSRLSAYRSAGLTAPRILALLAGWLGIACDGTERTAADFVGRFDLARLPRTAIRFSGIHD